MNKDQFIGLIRNCATLACGIAIGRGWITSDQSTLIIAILATLAPLIWTFMAHTNMAKITAAASVPEVSKVVVAQSANGKIGAAADDPAQEKIVKE